MTPPRYLGQFEVGAELGRGAAGVVYRAQERLTGRVVALKVVSRELAASPGFYERFLREASVAARVAHPNVAALHAAGEQEGALFLALELVPGGSLADQLRARGRLPWEEAAGLAAEVARGLGAVHAAGLVHRDVTPANVLLDKEGRAKLADFGLVRRVGASSAAEIGRLTETGEILGTLEYLSPEQANGAGEVGPSADLYGLGATLHALVAGAPPFQGEGVGLVKQHLLALPPRLAALVPDTPLALEALVQRLLEKDPARRGSGALEVATELEAILGSEAPASEGRRFPLLAAVFALGMGALGLGAGLAARGHSPPAPSPRPSSGAASPAPSLAPSPLRSPPVDRSALEAQLQQDTELKAISVRMAASSRFKLEGVWGRPAWTARVPITSGAVAPSGQWFVTGGMDWLVRRWDLEGHLLETLPMLAKGWVMALAVSPDGKTIAASGDRRDPSNGVALFDLEKRSTRVLPASPGAADSVAFSRDGARLLTAHDDGTLRVWDVANATELTCIHAHEPRPRGLSWQQRSLDAALSPDGHRAISGCLDGTLKVWELSSREEVARVPFPAAVVRVAWSPADDRALVGLASGSVAVLDLGGDKPSPPVFVETAAVPQHVFGLAFAPDGLSALVTHSSSEAVVLDLAASPVRVAQVVPVGRPGTLPFASFLPDGKRFLVGGESRSIGLFDAATGTDRRPAGAANRGAVWGLDVSPDGRRGVTAGTDAFVRTWDPATGREAGEIRSDDVASFLWAGVLPDGRRALTSSMGGEARLWDLERGAPLGPGAPVVPLPPAPPGSGFRPLLPLRIALFPDGQRFLAALPNGGIELWGVEALVRLATLRAGSPDAVPVAAAAISSDGARAITGSEGGELLLWDLVRQESRSLQPRSQPPAQARDKHVSAAFVPGTTTALVGGCDSSVTLWDLAGGRPLRRFPAVSQGNGVVQAVVVGPGARRFVSACEDGTVRLWDLASGAELDRIDLEPWGDVPQRLAVMDGGRSLLLGTARGVVYRFNVTWNDP